MKAETCKSTYVMFDILSYSKLLYRKGVDGHEKL